MGKKLESALTLLHQVKKLESLIIERIKLGDNSIKFEWTSDGEKCIASNSYLNAFGPDGSQTFTFKFGPDYGKS